MTIGYLSSGTLGFDTNTVITSKIARAAAAHHRQYKFVWRYVRRGPHHTYDIARDEIATIHAAGLGLGLVQHVADPGWYPSINLGTSYGSIAAAEASIAGYPPGCSLACDLEGVAHDASSKATIEHLNAWHYEVSSAGYLPPLYVGDSCRLTADQLYRNLRFKAYWTAYNLNRDQYPAVRGPCMTQHVAFAADLIPGLDNSNMDIDILQADRLGGLPMFYLP
jgi:hypothetical protein